MHVVRGIIFDKNGIPRLRIGGWWSREIWVEVLEVHSNHGVNVILPAKEVHYSREDRGMKSDRSTSHSFSSGPPLTTHNSHSSGQEESLEEEEKSNGRSHLEEEQEEHKSDGPWYHTRDPTTFISRQIDRISSHYFLLMIPFY